MAKRESIKTKDTREKHVQEAARAMSDLHIFSAVIALMEHSLVTSAAHAAEAEIVKICKRETARALARYDVAVEAVKR